MDPVVAAAVMDPVVAVAVMDPVVARERPRRRDPAQGI
jgi:hypothetical protein